MQLKENGRKLKKESKFSMVQLIMGKLLLVVFLEEDSSTFQEVFTLDDKQLW